MKFTLPIQEEFSCQLYLFKYEWKLLHFLPVGLQTFKTSCQESLEAFSMICQHAAFCLPYFKTCIYFENCPRKTFSYSIIKGGVSIICFAKYQAHDVSQLELFTLLYLQSPGESKVSVLYQLHYLQKLQDVSQVQAFPWLNIYHWTNKVSHRQF